jgi:hypothetical protein
LSKALLFSTDAVFAWEAALALLMLYQLHVIGASELTIHPYLDAPLDARLTSRYSLALI